MCVCLSKCVCECMHAWVYGSVCYVCACATMFVRMCVCVYMHACVWFIANQYKLFIIIVKCSLLPLQSSWGRRGTIQIFWFLQLCFHSKDSSCTQHNNSINMWRKFNQQFPPFFFCSLYIIILHHHDHAQNLKKTICIICIQHFMYRYT